jgi:SAM-dependent methyltransferase
MRSALRSVKDSDLVNPSSGQGPGQTPGSEPGPEPGRVRRPPTAAVIRREVPPDVSARAARGHWDADAAAYQTEHLEVLGTADLVWGPEGLREADARLLGDVAGRRILELGCGAAQCSRWLADHGARVVGIDISRGMLDQARRFDGELGCSTPLAQADGRMLPFSDASFDIVMSAFGVLPFVADSEAVFAEVARVLRSGGRFALSVVHPFAWVFPDSPSSNDLTVQESYFDRRPYVEEDRTGAVLYTAHHRTIGDRVREIRAAGLVLDDIVEPEWVREDPTPWGAWSPERAKLIPGTAILIGHLPDPSPVTDRL